MPAPTKSTYARVAAHRAKTAQAGAERFEVLLPPAEALKLRRAADSRGQSRNALVIDLIRALPMTE